LACAINAAARGHHVVLFESSQRIGGQLVLASRIPGKQEFLELLRYFQRQIELNGVEVRLSTTAGVSLLEDFIHVVVATGVEPHTPEIEGIEHPLVATYEEVISGDRAAGEHVAIIGAGGIGFDVAELLLADRATTEAFYDEWGVDVRIEAAGGLRPIRAPRRTRTVTMLQRSQGRPGTRLGRSTGWILREKLARRGLRICAGVRYERIDDRGLHYWLDGRPNVLQVDRIVTCAGQRPRTTLIASLESAGRAFDVIGGARLATELDAVRAIDEGARLGSQL
jgi:2,4-dienoyl-CoA reductase (NADPH2)